MLVRLLVRLGLRRLAERYVMWLACRLARGALTKALEDVSVGPPRTGVVTLRWDGKRWTESEDA